MARSRGKLVKVEGGSTHVPTSGALSKGPTMARGHLATTTVIEREQRTEELFDKLTHTSGSEARQGVVDTIAETNLPMSDALARRYVGRGCELDDLMQVARVGLMLAIDRFQPDAGRKFVRFAVPTITGELKRYFRDGSWMVRPPRRVQELRPQVESARNELAQELGREPSEAELSARLQANPKLVRECLNSTTSFRPVSLDAPVLRNSWVSLGDSLASGEREPSTAVAMLDLRAALESLSKRERKVISWRFVDDLTQLQIAQRLGCSQMQVSRILRHALKLLRAFLD
ncbi:RNA polymerase sigma-B factor [Tessaracoccus bendigoensis DSM 12906]|uniref:RNA polymerase sigma-B factor n=2 Tax=Tessaracoccus TaxID=72763 RepID=A0A1M6ERT4_9ACTN|nr:RNA polymerase sigma-B factor [Tessaracoccus bendigoensis DSM 12906]